MLGRMKNWLDDRSVAVDEQTPQFEQMEERLLLSGLLGINLEFPQGPYDASGTVAYTASTQAFDADATPLAFRFSATEARPITPPRDFSLNLLVDNAGNLVGGVAGHRRHDRSLRRRQRGL